jgi:hypothetical protein
MSFDLHYTIIFHRRRPNLTLQGVGVDGVVPLFNFPLLDLDYLFDRVLGDSCESLTLHYVFVNPCPPVPPLSKSPVGKDHLGLGMFSLPSITMLSACRDIILVGLFISLLPHLVPWSHLYEDCIVPPSMPSSPFGATHFNVSDRTLHSVLRFASLRSSLYIRQWSPSVAFT